MPTAAQIRAARGLLGWSVAEVAARAGVSARTVARCEIGQGMPQVTIRTLTRIRQAFVDAGIEFLNNNGVRRTRLS
jgi:transcriptional regulator with XRE-family HTH domain